ncbi:AMM_1a_G0039940.mRNA.1.CDS.1 [Saccharomyces cerevisiae]|nr:AMM_1a_G0039940.mRNA.1.CDS.1 [Saccharomyces cerevisiae]CAI4679586.1 BAP_1a_G0040010.mRNA.1.CDS.1 [Saccharomyces cerevisiae]CAI6830055.1 AMM_1a_G0039940.mRNA.1.CDS.1 [Saccharomyces cerevisiae]CAI7262198.1 BAP_1a_G0040010.mRNA.1.CDS.1 [Saccharomyces cerevisiae]
MLSYYEHNTAFQTNNCNSGSNAATTYNSDANNDTIMNKRKNDHFEFDTHTFYQRSKRTKRDSVSTKFSVGSGCANLNNNNNNIIINNNNNNNNNHNHNNSNNTTTYNNIHYQKNIEICPLKPVNMHHTMNSRLLNESEFYSETEEYMIHGYFGNTNRDITGTSPTGSASIIQHQYHLLPSQSIIASSQAPGTAMAALTNNNIANDYMDID